MAPKGTGRFLRLIADLARRPRRRDRPLPLVYVGGTGSSAVIDALQDRLKVPHGRVTVGNSSDVRSLLNEVRSSQTPQNFTASRLRFRHFALLDWLMRQDLPDLDSETRSTALSHLLRDRRRPGNGDNGNQPDVGQFGAVFNVVWWLLQYVLPAIVFRVAVSGRIPGVGRQYRWFMNQPYLMPAWSITFLGFAQRLTEPARSAEESCQVEKLLVHAFLEDLRQAHTRLPWRLSAWRRTTYPVMVIDGVAAGNAGHRLLQLVADVRHETGRPDPLLLVSSGEHAVADWTGLSTTIALDATPADVGAVRYLSIEIPEDTGTEMIDHQPCINVEKPPWFARVALVLTVCLTLLAATLGLTAWTLGIPGCSHMPFTGQILVHAVHGECVGYSDNSGFLFNDQSGQEKLRQVQETIYSQNRLAQDLWEKGERRRPYVTLVYLGSLTGRPVSSDEEAYAAEREELEGLAVAQYQGVQQSVNASSTPLLRIVVANAGFQMAHADTAVEMIKDLARQESDAPVVGVVGLVESRASTAEALKKLNEAGLPVVAPTLSADDMDDNSKLYLQLAPPNKDQAAMVASYARDVLRVSSARVYVTFGQKSPQKEDLYVNTLRSDLKKDLKDILEYDRVFNSGSTLRGECGYSGMLFFAGRWSEFSDFLQTLKTSCGNNQPRNLVADDSVNRYMANPALRRSAPSNLPLTYVSKAALTTCDALDERDRIQRDGVAGAFLEMIRDKELLHSPRCRGNDSEWVGERVGLAYDSATMLLQAVETLVARARVDGQSWDPRSITPVAVHAEVLHQNHVEPFYGVTGSTVFIEESGEPVDKRISLLRVAGIPASPSRPIEVFHCGVVKSGDTADCTEPR